jgi:hypothetical protein
LRTHTQPSGAAASTPSKRAAGATLNRPNQPVVSPGHIKPRLTAIVAQSDLRARQLPPVLMGPNFRRVQRKSGLQIRFQSGLWRLSGAASHPSRTAIPRFDRNPRKTGKMHQNAALKSFCRTP